MFIKYTFLPKHGTKQFTNAEAIRVCGEDPDYSKRDLWDAIERGDYPEWTTYVQIMTPEQADPDKLGFDPFDVTKVWPRSQFPLQEFGRIVLNKNPDDYHRDVEQSAFSPGSLVPGIETSPDALLQFRTFFYRDAQYHRLGVNLHQIPVNCPFMASSYSSTNFAGPMRVDANTGKKPHYYPNSYVDKYRPDAAETPLAVSDNVMSRQSHYWHEGKPNEYDQARELYVRAMRKDERARLHENIVFYLKWASPLVQKKYLAQQWAIHPDFAKNVYDLLAEKKFEFSEVEELGKKAHLVGKEHQWLPKEKHHKLVGNYPQVGGLAISS